MNRISENNAGTTATVLDLPRDRPAYWGNDQLKGYLKVAAAELGEERAFRILRANLGDAVEATRLSQFIESLNTGVTVPSRAYIDFIADLVDVGMDLAEMTKCFLTVKPPTPFHQKGEGAVMSRFTTQNILGPLEDLVTCTYAVHPDIEHIISNHLLLDCSIDMIKGSHRKVTITIMHLDRAFMTWMGLEMGIQVFAMMPVLARSKPARARHIMEKDFTSRDPRRPDEPVPASIRPSLTELLHRASLAPEKEGSFIMAEGKPVAVLDDPPGRVIRSGVYRALADIEVTSSGAKISGQDSLTKAPKGNLLIRRGYRYHLDVAIPCWNIEYEYEIHRPRTFIMLATAKAANAVWTRLGGLSGMNPWAPIKDLEQSRSHGVMGDKNAEPAEPDTNALSLEARVDRLSSLYDLSSREKEVLLHLASGESNSTIAEKLFISEATVKTHVSRLFRKTGADNRYQLISRILSNRAPV